MKWKQSCFNSTYQSLQAFGGHILQVMYFRRSCTCRRCVLDNGGSDLRKLVKIDMLNWNVIVFISTMFYNNNNNNNNNNNRNDKIIMTITIIVIITAMMITMIKTILLIVVVVIINSPFRPGDFSTGSTTGLMQFFSTFL